MVFIFFFFFFIPRAFNRLSDEPNTIEPFGSEFVVIYLYNWRDVYAARALHPRRYNTTGEKVNKYYNVPFDQA
jgi:hypothetical protein